MELQHVTITSIGGGYAPTLFDEGLVKILENLADPRTSVKKSRKISITFEFTTDELRQQTEIDVSMKLDLAQPVKKKALAFCSKDEEGNARMTCNNPKQAELAFELAKNLTGTGGKQ